MKRNPQHHACNQETQSTEPRASTQHWSCDLFLVRIGSLLLDTSNLNTPSRTSRIPFYWSAKNARKNNLENPSKESFHHLEYIKTTSFLFIFLSETGTLLLIPSSNPKLCQQIMLPLEQWTLTWLGLVRTDKQRLVRLVRCVLMAWHQ